MLPSTLFIAFLPVKDINKGCGVGLGSWLSKVPASIASTRISVLISSTHIKKQGLVVCVFNPSVGEVEAGGSLELTDLATSEAPD